MSNFPYVPDDPDGTWSVSLPLGAARIGEILVYATAITPPIPPYTGEYLLQEQSAVTSAVAYMYRASGLAPGANVSEVDVQMLVRLPANDQVIYLWSLDELSDVMCRLYVDTDEALHFYYMVDWSPFTSAALSAPVPVAAGEWFWVRVHLDSGVLDLEWSAATDIPSWSNLDSANLSGSDPPDTIPLRSGFGNADPFYVGTQGGTNPTADLDIRRVFWHFNAEPVVTSAFEVSSTVVSDTITDDTGTTYTKHSSIPMSIETA